MIGSGDRGIDSAVKIILACRLFKRFAFLIFLAPLLVASLFYLMDLRGSFPILFLSGMGLVSSFIFMHLRVPKPRIPWSVDFRHALLVLRSFSDARTYKGEEGSIDDFDVGPQAPDNFIWQLGLAIWDFARVVVVMEVKNTVTPVYSIVIESNKETWEADVLKAARGAWAILLFPGDTQGVIKEIQMLQADGLLWKTVFFMPPEASKWERYLMPFRDFIDYSSAWGNLRNCLERNGIHLPEYDSKGSFFYLDESLQMERFLVLNHDDYPWPKLREFVGRLSHDTGLLIDCIPLERSREADDVETGGPKRRSQS